MGPKGPASTASARARWRRWGFQLPHQGGPHPVYNDPNTHTNDNTPQTTHTVSPTAHIHTHPTVGLQVRQFPGQDLPHNPLPPWSKPLYIRKFHGWMRNLGTVTPISSKRPILGDSWGETSMVCQLSFPTKRRRRCGIVCPNTRQMWHACRSTTIICPNSPKRPTCMPEADILPCSQSSGWLLTMSTPKVKSNNNMEDA